MKELTSLSRYQVGVLQRSVETADLYTGTDTVLHRSVSLRVFKDARLSDVRLRNQLFQSLQRVTELVHPHIAWIWEIGEEDGVLFSAERSLSGEALSDRIPRDHRMSWDQAFRYFRHLCQAVQFAHGRKMIHGDVSPANVLITEEHGAVLMGFGIAPIFGKLPQTENDDQAGLARLLLVMLTGSMDAVAPAPNAIQWPFSIPLLARDPILRGLGMHPQGFYYNIEEFFESVEEQAALPQPDLPPEEVVRMQVEEDAYEKSFEAALQAREDAQRQEALAAARKEIGEEIQKALDEHLTMDEEPTSPEQPEEIQQTAASGQEEVRSQAAPEPSAQTLPPQPAEVVEAPVRNAAKQPESVGRTPDKKNRPLKKTKKARKFHLVFWIVLILLAFLAILAWLWFWGGLAQLFPI